MTRSRLAAYVDDQLVRTGKVSKAAILGKQGGIWAASKGYNVSLRILHPVVDTPFRAKKASARVRL